MSENKCSPLHHIGNFHPITHLVSISDQLKCKIGAIWEWNPSIYKPVFYSPFFSFPFCKVKEADPHHILKYFRRESESCFVVLESMWQWQTHICTLGLLIPNKLSGTVLLFVFHYKFVIKLDWGRFFTRCYLPFSWRSLSLSWSVPNFQSQMHKMSWRLVLGNQLLVGSFFPVGEMQIIFSITLHTFACH